MSFESISVHYLLKQRCIAIVLNAFSLQRCHLHQPLET